MIRTFKLFDTWIGREDTDDFLDLDDTPNNRVYQMVDVDNPNEKVYTAKESYWIKKLKNKEIKIYGMSIENKRLVKNKVNSSRKLLSDKVKGYGHSFERCSSNEMCYNSLTTILPKKTGRYTVLKVIETGEYRPMTCAIVEDNETGKKYLKYSLTCSKFDNETFTNAIVLRGYDGGYIVPKDDVPIVNVEVIQDDPDVTDVVNMAFDKLSESMKNIRSKLAKLLDDGWRVVSLDEYHYFISPDGLVDLKLGCKIYKELEDAFNDLENFGEQFKLQDFAGINYNIFVDNFVIGDMLEEVGAKYVDFIESFNLGNLKFSFNRGKNIEFKANLSLNSYAVKKVRDRYTGMKETDISDVRYTDYCLNAFKFEKRKYMKYAYCLINGVNENTRILVERNTPSEVVIYSKSLDFLCDSWVHQFVLKLDDYFKRFGWRIDDCDKKIVYLSNMMDPDSYSKDTDLIYQYFDEAAVVGDGAVKIKVESLRKMLSKYPFNGEYEYTGSNRVLKWSEIIFNFVVADASKEVCNELRTTKQTYHLIENAVENMIIMEFLNSGEQV